MASSDVPGFSIQCIRKSFSWKSGRNDSPRPRTPKPVATNAAARSTIAQPGRRASGGRIARYIAFRTRTSGDSRRRSEAPVRSISDRAGVTVSATSSEARMASTYASASGRKNEPGEPLEEEDRHEHQDHDQAGVDDGAPDLERGVQHHPERRPRPRQPAG